MEIDKLNFLKDNKGVIVTLFGGLGNQMFEVATGYALSIKYKLHFYIGRIPERIGVNNKHNFNKNNYYDTIFRYFFTNNIKLISSVNYQLLEKNEYLFKQEKSTFNNVKFPILTPNKGIIISGRFQNYNLFFNYENQIRNLFLKGFENNIELMKNKYDIEDAAFLHIRRGDYLLLQNLYKQPTMDYYKDCVRRLRRKNKNLKKIFIFTNDLKYAKTSLFFKRPLFTIVDEPDELNSLSLMSLCKAGAIITNSTFGWWGAFLGAHESRNPVFVFKRWILSGPTPHLCPKVWIKI